MTCSVTGTLVDPTGAALPDTPYRLARAGGIVGTGAGTVVPKIITGVSGTAAEFDEDLVAGNYLLTVYPATGQTYSVALPVPDEASAALSDLVTGGDAPQVAVWLTEARAAAAAAETAATAAEASAAAIQTYDSQAETSATSAADSATSAADSATSAADSATSAADSATSAASAATSASESAASAAGSVDVVEAARDLVEADRAEVEANKNLTYGYAQDAASAVVYQNLASIAASKAVTAVDVFVYDTSKDSDGGAWRHRCAGTSWYREALNTATRGTRREFPAVAIIVAESNKVTIYDGDDPTLPMWMVFIAAGGLASDANIIPGDTVTAVVARNGVIAISTNDNAGGRGGLNTIRLISEHIDHKGISNLYRDYDGNIAERNTGKNYSIGDNNVIVNAVINDIAVTVLPDAPIDPATGLPVPTIAVATAGGVSVIKDDGNVWDITDIAGGSYSASASVVFLPSNQLRFSQELAQSRKVSTVNIPTADRTVHFWSADSNSDDGLTLWGTKATSGSGPMYGELAHLGTIYGLRAVVCRDGSVGGSIGLTRVSDNPSSPAGSMVAYIAALYATGWLPGDIKGAFLSSTDTASLVGGDIAVNGTFDTDTVWNKSAGWTISGGVASVNSSVAGSTFIRQGTTVDGEQYRVTFDVTSHTSGQLKAAAGTAVSVEYASGVGSYSFNVVANGSGGVGIYAVGSGVVASVDNVTIEKLDPDRSVNNKGLIVNGTITRAPVATGAELVGYSGFSVDNYLEGTDASYVDTLYALGWEQTDGVWGFKHGVVSAAPIDGLTITGNTLKVAGTKPKALIRLTGTVPTADQIAKIEADERVLFQENAACTLYGASDAVTALAHDPDTGLLHVGTSQGRSVFDGLVRVANTTTPVGAAISAVNGLIAEE